MKHLEQLKSDAISNPEEYLKNVFGMFNYVNGKPSDLQYTYTCADTVQKVTRKLRRMKVTSKTKVLVMYNVEIAVALGSLGLKQSQITVYNNSTIKNRELQAAGFNTIFEVKFNKNKTIMKAYAKHFDVVLGNPPYKGRMHADFMEIGYDILEEDGKMVFVHPTNWLIHLRENGNFKKDLALKNKIGNHFVSFDFYNSDDLFPQGGCGTYYPLTITSIDKTKTNTEINFNRFDKVKGSYVVNSSLDINHVGSYTTIKSIEDKIRNKSNRFISDAIDNSQKNAYYVSLNWMSGNGFTTHEFSDGISRTFQNRYNFINSSNHIVTDKPLLSKPQKGKSVGNPKAGIPFNTNKDANAFLYYVTSTMFVKYLIITYNMDQNVQTAYHYVPMINSSLMMSDEAIFKFFEFTQEEVNLIKNTIESYKHA